MQKRHRDRHQYFKESADTSRRYFVPYIQKHHTIGNGVDVLEIGCGEGGNLLPFAEMGCNVTGIDIAYCRIEEAKAFFGEEQAKGVFVCDNIFNVKGLEHRFDVIICHDVLEHIREDGKKLLLRNLSKYLKPQGVVFMAFPPWQMPFGGHQQICKSRLLSHLPFFHLLPSRVYRATLKLAGEDENCVKELLSIKQTRVTIEHFERRLDETPLIVADRRLWMVNPHYEAKFRLSPRKLSPAITHIPHLRDFLCTSCFYLLQNNQREEQGSCPIPTGAFGRKCRIPT